MQCSIRIEVTLCHDQRFVGIIFLCGSNGCGPLLILRFQYTIAGNITEIIIRPYPVIAFLLRHLRNLICRQIVSVITFIGSHFLAICQESDRKLRKSFRNSILCTKLLIGQRCRSALVTDAVYTASTAFYIIIAVQAAVITDFTGNAALIFSGHIQIIVCITVKNIAAFSGDTADIIFTGDPAHAIAAADRIAGRSGNTTYITASGTFNGCIGFTGDNCSVFGFSDDTSHVVFFTGDITEIATVSYDCLDGLLHIKALRSGQGDVILRVKIIFRCHLAYDTADIGIRLYRTTIYTQCDFTFLEAGCVI